MLAQALRNDNAISYALQYAVDTSRGEFVPLSPFSLSFSSLFDDFLSKLVFLEP